jgi:hypothetical protein
MRRPPAVAMVIPALALGFGNRADGEGMPLAVVE